MEIILTIYNFFENTLGWSWQASTIGLIATCVAIALLFAFIIRKLTK